MDRLSLQSKLEQLLESENVYFQPPENFKMDYPAIRYRLTDIDPTFADNSVYKKERVYELILIDKNPDSIFVDRLAELPFTRFARSYTADNLNHWVFTLRQA